ncbi:hypothetical protein SNEBB_008291, partial [Seison nebaliae]
MDDRHWWIVDKMRLTNDRLNSAPNSDYEEFMLKEDNLLTINSFLVANSEMNLFIAIHMEQEKNRLIDKNEIDLDESGNLVSSSCIVKNSIEKLSKSENNWVGNRIENTDCSTQTILFFLRHENSYEVDRVSPHRYMTIGSLKSPISSLRILFDNFVIPMWQKENEKLLNTKSYVRTVNSFSDLIGEMKELETTLEKPPKLLDDIPEEFILELSQTKPGTVDQMLLKKCEMFLRRWILKIIDVLSFVCDVPITFDNILDKRSSTRDSISSSLHPKSAITEQQHITFEQKVQSFIENNGPLSELDLWQQKNQQINQILSELKLRQCKTVTTYLISSKSKLIKQWRQVDDMITDAMNESRDKLRFLQMCEKQLSKLYLNNFDERIDKILQIVSRPLYFMEDVVPNIFKIFVTNSTLTRFTARQGFLGVLLRKITNQIVYCFIDDIQEIVRQLSPHRNRKENFNNLYYRLIQEEINFLLANSNENINLTETNMKNVSYSDKSFLVDEFNLQYSYEHLNESMKLLTHSLHQILGKCLKDSSIAIHNIRKVALVKYFFNVLEFTYSLERQLNDMVKDLGSSSQTSLNSFADMKVIISSFTTMSEVEGGEKQFLLSSVRQSKIDKLSILCSTLSAKPPPSTDRLLHLTYNVLKYSLQWENNNLLYIDDTYRIGIDRINIHDCFTILDRLKQFSNQIFIYLDFINIRMEFLNFSSKVTHLPTPRSSKLRELKKKLIVERNTKHKQKERKNYESFNEMIEDMRESERKIENLEYFQYLTEPNVGEMCDIVLLEKYYGEKMNQNQLSKSSVDQMACKLSNLSLGDLVDLKNRKLQQFLVQNLPVKYFLEKNMKKVREVTSFKFSNVYLNIRRMQLNIDNMLHSYLNTQFNNRQTSIGLSMMKPFLTLQQNRKAIRPFMQQFHKHFFVSKSHLSEQVNELVVRDSYLLNFDNCMDTMTAKFLEEYENELDDNNHRVLLKWIHLDETINEKLSYVFYRFELDLCETEQQLSDTTSSLSDIPRNCSPIAALLSTSEQKLNKLKEMMSFFQNYPYIAQLKDFPRIAGMYQSIERNIFDKQKIAILSLKKNFNSSKTSMKSVLLIRENRKKLNFDISKEIKIRNHLKFVEFDEEVFILNIDMELITFIEELKWIKKLNLSCLSNNKSPKNNKSKKSPSADIDISKIVADYSTILQYEVKVKYYRDMLSEMLDRSSILLSNIASYHQHFLTNNIVALYQIIVPGTVTLAWNTLDIDEWLSQWNLAIDNLEISHKILKEELSKKFEENIEIVQNYNLLNNFYTERRDMWKIGELSEFIETVLKMGINVVMKELQLTENNIEEIDLKFLHDRSTVNRKKFEEYCQIKLSVAIQQCISGTIEYFLQNISPTLSINSGVMELDDRTHPINIEISAIYQSTEISLEPSEELMKNYLIKWIEWIIEKLLLKIEKIMENYKFLKNQKKITIDYKDVWINKCFSCIGDTYERMRKSCEEISLKYDILWSEDIRETFQQFYKNFNYKLSRKNIYGEETSPDQFDSLVDANRLLRRTPYITSRNEVSSSIGVNRQPNSSICQNEIKMKFLMEKIEELNRISFALDTLPDYSHYSCCQLKLKMIKNVLFSLCSSWKIKYLKILHVDANNILRHIVEFRINNFALLSRELNSLEELNELLDVIESTEEKNFQIDFIHRPIERSYTILKHYKAEINRNELKLVDNLLGEWGELMKLSDSSKTNLVTKRRSALIEQLDKQSKSFVVEVIRFRNDFDLNGPTAESLNILSSIIYSSDEKTNNSVNVVVDPHSIIEKLNEFKKKFDVMNIRRCTMLNISKLFSLKLRPYTELDKISVELDWSQQLYSCHGKLYEFDKHFQTSRWCDVNFKMIDKQMKEIYEEFERLPQSLNEYASHKHLRICFDHYFSNLPLLSGMSRIEIHNRHWLKFMRVTQQTFSLQSNEFIIKNLMDIQLNRFESSIQKIIREALKEYQLSELFRHITEKWNEQVFQFESYVPDSITDVSKSSKKSIPFLNKENSFKILEELDDSQILLSEMLKSKYVSPLGDQVAIWAGKLRTIFDSIEIWLKVQKKWKNLLNIFNMRMSTNLSQSTQNISLIAKTALTFQKNNESSLINEELYEEQKQFISINRQLMKIQREAADVRNILQCILSTDRNLMNDLRRLMKECEVCENSLQNYLYYKRSVFPRFYYLTDEQFLEIIVSFNSLEHDGKKFFLQNSHVTSQLFTSFYSVEDEVGTNYETSINSIISSNNEVVPLSNAISYKRQEIQIEHLFRLCHDELNRTISNNYSNSIKFVRARSGSAGLVRQESVTNDSLMFVGQLEEMNQRFLCQTIRYSLQYILTKEIEQILVMNKKDRKAMQLILKKYNSILQKICNSSSKFNRSSSSTSQSPRVRRLKFDSIFNYLLRSRDQIDLLINKRVRDISEYEWQKNIKVTYDKQKEKISLQLLSFSYDVGTELQRCDGSSDHIMSAQNERSINNILLLCIHNKKPGFLYHDSNSFDSDVLQTVAHLLSVFYYKFHCAQHITNSTIENLIKATSSDGHWLHLDNVQLLSSSMSATLSREIHDTYTHLHRSSSVEKFPFQTSEYVIMKKGRKQSLFERLNKLPPDHISPSTAIFISTTDQYKNKNFNHFQSLFRTISIQSSNIKFLIYSKFISCGFRNSCNLTIRLINFIDSINNQLSKECSTLIPLRLFLNVIELSSYVKKSQEFPIYLSKSPRSKMETSSRISTISPFGDRKDSDFVNSTTTSKLSCRNTLMDGKMNNLMNDINLIGAVIDIIIRPRLHRFSDIDKWNFIFNNIFTESLKVEIFPEISDNIRSLRCTKVSCEVEKRKEKLSTILEEIAMKNDDRIQFPKLFINNCLILEKLTQLFSLTIVFGDAGCGKSLLIKTLLLALNKITKHFHDDESVSDNTSTPNDILQSTSFKFERIFPEAQVFPHFLFGHQPANTGNKINGHILKLVDNARNKQCNTWLWFDGSTNDSANEDWPQQLATCMEINKKMFINDEMDETEKSKDDNSVYLQALNGERFVCAPNTKIVVETAILNNISPSFLSRCALLYVNNDMLTWRNFIPMFLETRNKLEATVLENCFRKIMPNVIDFIKKFCGKSIQLFSMNTQFNFFLKLLATILDDNHKSINGELHVERLFFFCLIWTFGSSILPSNARLLRHSVAQNHNRSKKSSGVLIEGKEKENWKPDENLIIENDENSLDVQKEFSLMLRQLSSSLPDDDSEINVFDYYVDESGEWDTWTSRMQEEIENDRENMTTTITTANQYDVQTIQFFYSHLNTVEHIRTQLLLQLAMKANLPIMLYGGHGCGKSHTVQQLLKRLPLSIYERRHFTLNGLSSANDLQKYLEDCIVHRQGFTYGARDNKKLLWVLDDISSIKHKQEKESYVTNSIYEWIRQLIDIEQMYALNDQKNMDKKLIENFQIISIASFFTNDTQLIFEKFKETFSKCQRFLRHFFPISMMNICSDSLNNLINRSINLSVSVNSSCTFDEDMKQLIVNRTKLIFERVQAILTNNDLLRISSHYTFSYYHLHQMFNQFRFLPEYVRSNRSNIQQFWQHELLRTFSDRIIRQNDLNFIQQLIRSFTQLDICRFDLPFFTLLPIDVGIKPITNVDIHEQNVSVTSRKQSQEVQIDKKIEKLELIGNEQTSFLRLLTVENNDKEQQELLINIGDEPTAFSIISIESIREYLQKNLHRFDSVSTSIELSDENLNLLIKIHRSLSNIQQNNVVVVDVEDTDQLVSISILACRLKQLTILPLPTLAAKVSKDKTEMINDSTKFADFIRNVMRITGIENKQVALIFDEDDLSDDYRLTILNSLIKSGQVPSLFSAEELNGLIQTIQISMEKSYFSYDSYDYFVQKVLANLHIIICIRQDNILFDEYSATFPGFLTHSSIIWNKSWNEENIRSISDYSMNLMMNKIIKLIEPDEKDENDQVGSKLDEIHFKNVLSQIISDLQISIHKVLDFHTRETIYDQIADEDDGKIVLKNYHRIEKQMKKINSPAQSPVPNVQLKQTLKKIDRQVQLPNLPYKPSVFKSQLQKLQEMSNHELRQRFCIPVTKRMHQRFIKTFVHLIQKFTNEYERRISNFSNALSNINSARQLLDNLLLKKSELYNSFDIAKNNTEIAFDDVRKKVLITEKIQRQLADLEKRLEKLYLEKKTRKKLLLNEQQKENQQNPNSNEDEFTDEDFLMLATHPLLHDEDEVDLSEDGEVVSSGKKYDEMLKNYEKEENDKYLEELKGQEKHLSAFQSKIDQKVNLINSSITKLDRSCIERIRSFNNPPVIMGYIVEMSICLLGQPISSRLIDDVNRITSLVPGERVEKQVWKNLQNHLLETDKILNQIKSIQWKEHGISIEIYNQIIVYFIRNAMGEFTDAREPRENYKQKIINRQKNSLQPKPIGTNSSPRTNLNSSINQNTIHSVAMTTTTAGSGVPTSSTHSQMMNNGIISLSLARHASEDAAHFVQLAISLCEYTELLPQLKEKEEKLKDFERGYENFLSIGRTRELKSKFLNEEIDRLKMMKENENEELKLSNEEYLMEVIREKKKSFEEVKQDLSDSIKIFDNCCVRKWRLKKNAEYCQTYIETLDKLITSVKDDENNWKIFLQNNRNKQSTIWNALIAAIFLVYGLCLDMNDRTKFISEIMMKLAELRNEDDRHSILIYPTLKLFEHMSLSEYLFENASFSPLFTIDIPPAACKELEEVDDSDNFNLNEFNIRTAMNVNYFKRKENNLFYSIANWHRISFNEIDEDKKLIVLDSNAFPGISQHLWRRFLSRHIIITENLKETMVSIIDDKLIPDAWTCICDETEFSVNWLRSILEEQLIEKRKLCGPRITAHTTSSIDDDSNNNKLNISNSDNDGKLRRECVQEILTVRFDELTNELETSLSEGFSLIIYDCDADQLMGNYRLISALASKEKFVFAERQSFKCTIGDLDVECSPDFRLYLHVSSKMNLINTQLSTITHLVNFQLCEEDLFSYFLNEYLLEEKQRSFDDYAALLMSQIKSSETYENCLEEVCNILSSDEIRSLLKNQTFLDDNSKDASNNDLQLYENSSTYREVIELLKRVTELKKQQNESIENYFIFEEKIKQYRQTFKNQTASISSQRAVLCYTSILHYSTINHYSSPLFTLDQFNKIFRESIESAEKYSEQYVLSRLTSTFWYRLIHLVSESDAYLISFYLCLLIEKKNRLLNDGEINFIISPPYALKQQQSLISRMKMINENYQSYVKSNLIKLKIIQHNLSHRSDTRKFSKYVNCLIDFIRHHITDPIVDDLNIRQLNSIDNRYSQSKKPFDWMMEEQYVNLQIMARLFPWFSETFDRLPKDGRETLWRNLCENESVHPRIFLERLDNIHKTFDPTKVFLLLLSIRPDRFFSLMKQYINVILTGHLFRTSSTDVSDFFIKDKYVKYDRLFPFIIHPKNIIDLMSSNKRNINNQEKDDNETAGKDEKKINKIFFLSYENISTERMVLDYYESIVRYKRKTMKNFKSQIFVHHSNHFDQYRFIENLLNDNNNSDRFFLFHRIHFYWQLLELLETKKFDCQIFLSGIFHAIPDNHHKLIIRNNFITIRLPSYSMEKKISHSSGIMKNLIYCESNELLQIPSKLFSNQSMEFQELLLIIYNISIIDSLIKSRNAYGTAAYRSHQLNTINSIIATNSMESLDEIFFLLLQQIKSIEKNQQQQQHQTEVNSEKDSPTNENEFKFPLDFFRQVVAKNIYSSLNSCESDNSILSSIVDYWLSNSSLKKEFEINKFRYHSPSFLFNTMKLQSMDIINNLHQYICQHEFEIDTCEGVHLHPSLEITDVWKNHNKEFFQLKLDCCMNQYSPTFNHLLSQNISSTIIHNRHRILLPQSVPSVQDTTLLMLRNASLANFYEQEILKRDICDLSSTLLQKFPNNIWNINSMNKLLLSTNRSSILFDRWLYDEMQFISNIVVEVKNQLECLRDVLSMKNATKSFIQSLPHFITKHTKNLKDITYFYCAGQTWSYELLVIAKSIYRNELTEGWRKTLSPLELPLNFTCSSFITLVAQRYQHVDRCHSLEKERMPAYNLGLFHNPLGLIEVFKHNYLLNVAKGDEMVGSDDICIQTEMTIRDRDHLRDPPKEGLFVYGLFLWGCSFDKATSEIIDQAPRSNQSASLLQTSRSFPKSASTSINTTSQSSMSNSGNKVDDTLIIPSVPPIGSHYLLLQYRLHKLTNDGAYWLTNSDSYSTNLNYLSNVQLPVIHMTFTIEHRSDNGKNKSFNDIIAFNKLPDIGSSRATDNTSNASSLHVLPNRFMANYNQFLPIHNTSIVQRSPSENFMCPVYLTRFVSENYTEQSERNRYPTFYLRLGTTGV